MKIAVRAMLAMSLLVNVALIVTLFFAGTAALDGCAETDGELGVLSRDLEVGRFDGKQALFTLPKGLVVRSASATGMDWLEPYRFRIVVTSDESGLVHDAPESEGLVSGLTEFYSADLDPSE